jgi:branched-chain amino acid transport system permease protein
MTRRYLPLAGKIAALVLFAVFLALLPNWISDVRAQQFAYVGIFFIAILGLNIVTGYAGQISLGHGAFMAVGGYVTAILLTGGPKAIPGFPEGSEYLNLWRDFLQGGMRDLYTIPIAGLVAGVAGLGFGLPALRLPGLYLALATFGVAVATPQVIRYFDGVSGGTSGIQLFGHENLTGATANAVHLPGRTVTFNEWLYHLTWGIALVLLVVAWILLASRFGRALRAIRDSEVAAASSGISLPLYKTLAFGISAFYAGVAGALYAIANTFVNPETFRADLSLALVIGAAVAGLGWLSGLVVGALFVYFLENVASLDFLPAGMESALKTPGVPDMVYGVVLIAVMLALPYGVGGALGRLFRPLTNRLYTRSS